VINLSPVSTTPAITENPWQGLIAGVIDTDDKFIAGVVDTGEQLIDGVVDFLIYFENSWRYFAN
jgi:hypothetical protein